MKISKDQLLTPSEAAVLLSVSPTTIRLWAQNGRISFVKTPGGHRRFARDELLTLMIPSTSKVNTTFSILIVEDEKKFADLLVQIIENHFPDIQVSVAYSGFEAGDLLHALKPDLVILDLMMAGVDGFSICHRIKNNPSTRHIDVIAMTGALTKENVNRIILLGAKECFGKPLDYDLIKETITQIINNKHNLVNTSL